MYSFKVFVLILRLGLVQSTSLKRADLSGRCYGPGSTTWVFMMLTPHLKGPRPTLQAGIGLEEMHLMWSRRMERRSPSPQHSILREKFPDSNHLTSYQRCCGRIRLNLAWLFSRKETPNAFTTGENPPLESSFRSPWAPIWMWIVLATQTVAITSFSILLEKAHQPIKRWKGSFQPLTEGWELSGSRGQQDVLPLWRVAITSIYFSGL